jgi:hypothetical protein
VTRRQGRRAGTGPRRRAAVGVYLLTAFAVSVVTLTAITAVTTRSSFKREQQRVESELRVAAQREMDTLEDVAHIEGFFTR